MSIWDGAIGGRGWDGEAANVAALPVASSNTGNVYLVLASTGDDWDARKGFYRSDGVNWERVSNATFVALDSETTFKDDGDPTRILNLQLSGITAGNTRTLTIPDGSGTLLLSEGLAGSQTINGGTASEEDLIINSTSHATKGKIKTDSAIYFNADSRTQIEMPTADTSGSSLFSYSGIAGWNSMELSRNSYYNLSAGDWYKYDVTKDTGTIVIDQDSSWEFWTAPAAANPIGGGWEQVFQMTKTGKTTFNWTQNDADFTVRAVGQANALFVQGSNGYVGIGTAAPENSLHIVTVGTALKLELTNNDTDRIRYPLNIKHTTDQDMIDGFGSSILFQNQDNAEVPNFIASIKAVRDGADNEGSLILQAGTDGTEEFVVIKSSGNVGIGISAPGALLDINGNFMVIGSDAGVNGLRTDDTNKFARIAIPNFDNEASDVTIFGGASISGISGITFGGGVSGQYAATKIVFYTGATATTDTGTERVAIDENGIVQFISTGGLPFGSCYGDHIGWSQAAAVQDTWYNIVDASMINGQLNGVTHDGNGKLTVTIEGMYLINYSATIEVNTANDHFEMGIEIDGSGSANAAGHAHTESKFANQEHALSSTAILDLAANATIEIAIRTLDVATPTLSVQDLNVTIVQLGGT